MLLATEAMAAQSSAPARANPFDTPEAALQGRALFQTHCSYCHGANGEGGRGADLTTGQYRRGGSDVNLFATVRNGIGIGDARRARQRRRSVEDGGVREAAGIGGPG